MATVYVLLIALPLHYIICILKVSYFEILNQIILDSTGKAMSSALILDYLNLCLSMAIFMMTCMK